MNKKETPNEQLERTRALSAVMIVAMALIVFAGIALAENSNTSAGAETVQNSKSAPQENSIENTSFEIKVLQGNERLKLPEKRIVGASQERSKDISLSIVSQNNKGLKVSSFSKNTTAGISRVLNVSRSSVTEEWKTSKLPPSADTLKLGEDVVFGATLTNERSRFAEPDLWVGAGADPVPGITKTAYAVANDYKPWLYNRTDQCPDAVYYRVVKGYDPYTGSDVYVIQYFVYWRCQDCFGAWHEYDYEPIFIWARNIGERPYRVAYDRMGKLRDSHVHEIHRTHLWTSNPDGYYYNPPGTYTNDKAYYPFGNISYETPGLSGIDIYLETLPTSLRNNWDGNHVRLGIANCWHTFDTDISGSCCSDYTLSPLTDDELVTAYRLELDDTSGSNCCRFCGVEAFKYDISDPFHGVFWTDHYTADTTSPPSPQP
jgi:hypothetical protein